MKNPTSIFKLAARFNAQKEGGLVDDPDDPGGITNYGFSIRYAKAVGDSDGDGFDDFDFDQDGDVDADDIRDMTPEQALQARRYLWDKWRCNELPDPTIAIKFFDLCFPLGYRRSALALQRALRANGYPVVEDGIAGTKTLLVLSRFQDRPAPFLTAYMSEIAGIFRLQKSQKYEDGWLNRAYELPFMEKQDG